MRGRFHNFSLPAVKPIPQRVALVHIPVDVVTVKADETEERDHRPQRLAASPRLRQLAGSPPHPHASTVDCNAKEDDDQPGGEMCTDTTRTHFGLGPSSHMPTQRSSYYSLLFALAATILLLSPLLLRIATRPLAEPGALRLLRSGEIASGRQRVPATTTALSGSRVAVEL
ncbi:hypothetical protein B0H14DRAFT_3500297 [Mycena olivaceomarginata]|nr:hypothetical protein B0H14DRAFT_3500297 [Mycena olivaceomarginata]